ncbi:MAG: polyphosphate kinase 1 [SAR324 cluster bacterium]|nr:polyphosphate kinase 1 [SAR324 cluster bacterium]
MPELPLDWENLDPADLKNPLLYINRELSWLEFNQRVLDQAYDDMHPLLERVKFLAIVGTNLDEFFMIRLATIIKKIVNNIDDLSQDGLTTRRQFWAIRERAEKMLNDMTQCWEKTLKPQLREKSIVFLDAADYTDQIRQFLSSYFLKEIYPVLTPLAYDPGHPFPHISNLSTSLAVVIRHQGETRFARVKITAVLPRFVRIPEQVCGISGHVFVFVEDVLKDHMQELFPGTKIEEIYLFRMIRDTDVVIQEDEADDLLQTVDESLKRVRYGEVSMLQVEQNMPDRILNILIENTRAMEGVVTRTDSRMNYGSLMQLYQLHRPQLKDTPFSPPVLFSEHNRDTLLERIKIQDLLVHHPFESFVSVENFISAAVNDPNVIVIKMTLYRIGSNSPIVDQLIQAAEAGKQVSVLVELKARFDEKNNIIWAKRLEEVGVHVVYGVMKLKTHCKLCLVIRKESDGIRRYMHIGSGNYNRGTAQIYTDTGLFTANDEIGGDVSDVFNVITGYSNKKDYKHLLVAPAGLRPGIMRMIEREILHAREGRETRIIIKANGLTDPEIIRAMYQASQAGIKIDLIVRGICCLRPGIKGISENIRVISVVGRFLEHSRIYYFLNGGQENMYIGSADLMERNLDKRVEVLCPVLDPKIMEHLKNMVLGSVLNDSVRAFVLQSNGKYERLKNLQKDGIDSQDYLLNWYAKSGNL